MRSVQKVSSHVLWKIDAFIEKDTWYKKYCTEDNDAPVPFKVDTLGPHSVLTAISCPITFFCISSTVRNVFPFKGNFSFGKTRSFRASNLGCSGAESPGWFDLSSKCSTGDLMHEQVHCREEAANHQLSIAAAFWMIEITSTEEC